MLARRSSKINILTSPNTESLILQLEKGLRLDFLFPQLRVTFRSIHPYCCFRIKSNIHLEPPCYTHQSKVAMVFPILGIILACLSLPFFVYAGERTIGRRIPRPRLFRSFSAPPRPSPHVITASEERPSTPRRQTTTDGPQRVDTNASECSWMSTSTGETYVRGMGLEKVGLD